MKTILFPTDFSPNADNALNYAVQLSLAFKARLVLFNVCHISAYTAGDPIDEDIDKRLLAVSNERLQRIKERVELQGNEIEMECVVSFGLATENIISLAAEKKADLIVMGTKGATGLNETILGSNASAALERATCPVLIIPDHARYNKINRIVFAADFNESDLQSLAFIIEIAANFLAEVFIVHISETAQTADYEKDLLEWYKQELKKQLNIHYDNISFHLSVGHNVEDKLNDFIMQNKVDMFAMVTRKRKMISKIFERSLTKKMACHSHVPLLSFHG